MKKILTTILVFLGFLTLGATISVNAAATPVASFKSEEVVTGSAYTKYENTDWIVTCGGNNKSVGSNSSNKAKCVLGAYGYVGTPMSFDGTTALTSAVISKNPIENVKEITYTCASGGNGDYAKTDIYLVSSDSANTGFSQVGEKKTWATSLTFPVNETGSKYYALVFHNGTGTANFRIDSVVADFMPNEITDPSKTYWMVTYDSQNGVEATQEKVEENTVAPKPADPTRDGFVFTGWYKDAGCTQAWNFESDVVTSEMTLYAGWETDPYSYALIETSAFVSSGYADNNKTHIAKDATGTKEEFSYFTHQVMLSNNLIQFQKDASYLYNSTSVKGNINSIILSDLSGNPDVYSSSTLISDVATATKLTGVNGVYTVPEGNNHSYFYIVGGTSTMKASSIKVQYTYVEPTTYSVTFNANGGIFKDAVGETITKNIGETCSGTLPLASDLSQTLYKYTTLRGWSDGTKEYLPGAAYEVTDNTAFTAVYDVPAYITLAQACEICDMTGKTKTPMKFTSKGLVTEKSGSTVLIKDNSTSQLVTIYGGDSSSLAVGDYIEVSAKLQKYNDTTYEFVDSPKCTILFAGSKFLAAEVKSSLKITYDAESNPTDVDLRLGGVVDSSVVVAGATFGVFVTDQAFTFESGISYSSVEEFLAANQASNVKNVECTPAVVAGGHQFAWVITDMEGHYDTNLTAVMYMVYDGVLYICSSKTTSVKSTASEYLNDTTITLTDAEKAVLNKLIA